MTAPPESTALGPSPVLSHAARRMSPLLLLASVWMLWRGHHEPGGGFVGGLLAASALILLALAGEGRRARRLLRRAPGTLVVLGLAVALGAALVGPALGEPLLRAQWWGAFGTPLLFDAGVYLVVTGVTTLLLWTLLEQAEDQPC